MLRELASLAAGIFFVLVMIMTVTRGAKLLGLAASGSVASESVAALLGFTLLASVPWLLAVTVFFAVLSALTRIWRDHEMAVWLAAGQPLTAWVRPVLTFAVPMALVAALLSLGLTPWAQLRSREYREQLATRDDLSSLAPGLFKESSSTDRVYFIENFAGQGGAARNIFVQSTNADQQAITVAAEGYVLSHPDGERVLVLQHGRRYEGVPGHADYRLIEFNESRIRIQEPSWRAVSPQTEGKPSFALLRSPLAEDKAELIWRFAIPIATILLALLAVPLAYVNPRVGRTFNLIMAGLLFSIYLNLINMSVSWIAAGRLPVIVGMWPLHVAVALLTWVLFRWRARPQS